MKLKQITKNASTLTEGSPYDGLEDNDQFGYGGNQCAYCGISDDQDEIINFGGELVCTSCMEDRPTHEWLRFNKNITIERIKKFLETFIEKENNNIYNRGAPIDPADIMSINDSDKTIDVQYKSTVQATQHWTLRNVAKDIVEQIKNARNTKQQRW